MKRRKGAVGTVPFLRCELQLQPKLNNGFNAYKERLITWEHYITLMR